MKKFTLIALLSCFSVLVAFSQKTVKTSIEQHDGKVIKTIENTLPNNHFEDEILLQKNHSQKSVKQKPAILKTSADLISQEKVKTLENEFEVLTELKKSKIDKLKSTLPIKSDGSYVTEADSLVLVTLYNSTNGSSWTDNTNWLTGPVNSWYGITVNSGQVTSINIQSNNLAGSIPSELGTLTSLQILNFYNNSLTGSIPSELGNLTNLTELALWVNQLSGSIPPELGNLTNLFYLDIDGNQLTGSIPPELGNLSNLNNIWFGNNLL